jgi:hypothetical protein
MVNGRNLEITEYVREYVSKKVDRLERYLPQIGEVRADLNQNMTRSADDRFTAQITILGKWPDPARAKKPPAISLLQSMPRSTRSPARSGASKDDVSKANAAHARPAQRTGTHLRVPQH